MIDPISSQYLAGLAVELSMGVISALTRKTREQFESPAHREALARCFQAATVVLLPAPADQAEQEQLRPVLQTFFAREDVRKELAALVRGRELDRELLVDLFEEAPETETLPAYDFETRLADFTEAFLQAVSREPVLVNRIGIEQARQANDSLLELVANTEAIRRAVEQFGPGSVTAEGDIQAHDIVTGVQINLYGQGESSPADPCPALAQRYLKALRQEVVALPLAALEEEAADSRRPNVTLDRVYIALDTQSTVPLTEAEKKKAEDRFRSQDERPLSALEAAAQNKRLVLLGDPGSGKSVFANHLAYLLIQAHLAGQPLPEPWSGPAQWPVRLILRDLAARLDPAELGHLPATRQREQLMQLTRAYLLDQFTTLTLTPAEAEQWYACLLAGHCLTLFDGLDEVPLDQLPWARRIIELLAGRHEGPVIVTCRIRSYQSMPPLAGFATETLAPFSREQQDTFIQAWYSAQTGLTETDRGERAADLQQAVRNLPELAQNPLLLTTMALVHTAGVGLPRERVRLYARSVEVLMRRWQRHKHGAASLLDQLGIDSTRLLRGLWALAYQAHQAGQSGQSADIDQDQAIGLLARTSLAGDYHKAQLFLAYVDRQAGLLWGRGGSETTPPVYSFAHRTFQEYLAGCHLALAERQGLPRALREKLAEGERWYLAGQLAAEHLLYNVGDEFGVLELLYQLCPVREPAGEADWRGVAWAGVIAAEMGTDRIAGDTAPDGGRQFLDRLAPRLADIVSQGMLTVAERADAGDALAALDGDTRPGVGVVTATEDALPLPDHQFCLVPSGPFWLGSRREEDDLAYDEEYGHDEPFDLDYPYWIGRYPVTQRQYQAFVQATGHRAPFREADWARPYNWEEGRPPSHRRNHPVVLVSWRDALAYCAWLSGHLQDHLPPDYLLRLPTEAEWEKAARGGLEIPRQPYPATAGAKGVLPLRPSEVAMQPNPHPKRRWPWGEWTEDSPIRQANTNESERRGTMAVGSFPAGLSPYGCLDMAGNVWEWTLSQFQDYPYRNDDRNNPEGSDSRVLRGGSWSVSQRYARVSARYPHPSRLLPRCLLFSSGGRPRLVVLNSGCCLLVSAILLPGAGLKRNIALSTSQANRLNRNPP